MFMLTANGDNIVQLDLYHGITIVTTFAGSRCEVNRQHVIPKRLQQRSYDRIIIFEQR